MADLYYGNDECIVCGSGSKPALIRQVEENSGLTRIDCAECGVELMKGVIAKDGVIKNVPQGGPSRNQQELFIDENLAFDTLEMWWSRYRFVAAFHGRVVSGNESFYRLIEMLPISYE